MRSLLGLWTYITYQGAEREETNGDDDVDDEDRYRDDNRSLNTVSSLRIILTCESWGVLVSC